MQPDGEGSVEISQEKLAEKWIQEADPPRNIGTVW